MERKILRFSLSWRVQHFLLMISVILLIITGFALKYYDTWFGRFLIFLDKIVDVNFKAVQRDGSYGAHNIKYVPLLLNAIEKEIKAQVRKPDLELVYKNNSRCLDCYFGGEPSQGLHGKVLGFVNDCNKCHHKGFSEGKIECQHCHKNQASFYSGKFLADLEDFMLSAGLTCQDCHLTGNCLPVRVTADVCGTCHEQSCVDDFVRECERLRG